MIEVERLTKHYGPVTAIRDVSFSVAPGHIVGFLGPNGAGKSTTMRILSCFMPASSGTARVAGHDVFRESLEVRRRIGYLPESVPLYTEMRVAPYLDFVAEVKGVSRSDRRRRVADVMDRCLVADVQNRLIGTLSKGYRQRVGLADALLASPPVLILDEPTAGLDPTQIRATRALIHELGREHTILLSTHILPEVEKTPCDRVIIIHQGRVAASGTLADLQEQASANACLIAEFDGSIDENALGALPGLTDAASARVDGGVQVRLQAGDLAGLTPRLCNLAATKGWKIREIRPERPTLEDLFVRITGREGIAN